MAAQNKKISSSKCDSVTRQNFSQAGWGHEVESEIQIAPETKQAVMAARRNSANPETIMSVILARSYLFNNNRMAKFERTLCLHIYFLKKIEVGRRDIARGVRSASGLTG